MTASLGAYALVVAAGMAKSILGPITGYGLRLSPLETAPLSALGMLATVAIVTLGGERVRPLLARRLRRSDRPRREISPRLRAVWDRWGMPGIAFFTPLLFSPP